LPMAVFKPDDGHPYRCRHAGGGCKSWVSSEGERCLPCGILTFTYAAHRSKPDCPVCADKVKEYLDEQRRLATTPDYVPYRDGRDWIREHDPNGEIRKRLLARLVNERERRRVGVGAVNETLVPLIATAVSAAVLHFLILNAYKGDEAGRSANYALAFTVLSAVCCSGVATVWARGAISDAIARLDTEGYFEQIKPFEHFIAVLGFGMCVVTPISMILAGVIATVFKYL
jgi:hypothetical protein